MIAWAPNHLSLEAVESWFQDEARVGQRGTVTRMWAPKGSRPRVIRPQQFEAAYGFGAVCPAEDKAAALGMTKANSEAMQQHLEVIAEAVASGKHAVLVVDRAAWHVTAKLRVPANLSLLPLPPYSPELNPVEQVGQQLRHSDGANRCFKNYDDIVEVCCQAWSRFAKQPDAIRTLCSRKWAVIV
ncbi:MAG: IS630 family transposase [Dehalococcoidia bacterium]|nr:IS630 family transposase [Dehalococcoidia bacterium]